MSLFTPELSERYQLPCTQCCLSRLLSPRLWLEQRQFSQQLALLLHPGGSGADHCDRHCYSVGYAKPKFRLTSQPSPSHRALISPLSAPVASRSLPLSSTGGFITMLVRALGKHTGRGWNLRSPSSMHSYSLRPCYRGT